MNVWNKLTATPYWKIKTDAEIQSELESLANYELDEATALAENSLKKGWAKAVYDGSSVKIVEKVRKERPKPLVINPPKPREPEPSPEELARKNQAALVLMAHQFYEEVKKGRIPQAPVCNQAEAAGANIHRLGSRGPGANRSVGMKVASLCFGKPKPPRSLLPMVAD